MGGADQGRRLGRWSSVTALGFGALVLALLIPDVPLARLAHQSVNASGGSVPIWVSAALAAVGFVLAWRKPRNPLGWMFLAGAVFGALSEDASFYVVADYPAPARRAAARLGRGAHAAGLGARDRAARPEHAAVSRRTAAVPALATDHVAVPGRGRAVGDRRPRRSGKRHRGP